MRSGVRCFSALAELETEGLSEHLSELESLRQSEDEERAETVKPHGHDLVRLAAASGIELDEQLRKYFRALSVVNQLGRYPIHKTDGNTDLEPFVGNATLRARLNVAIEQRYRALTKGPE